MRAIAATAGLVSVAAFLSPACSGETDRGGSEDPVRRAAFRVQAARHQLLSCPGADRRRETRLQLARLETLRQLAARKGADTAFWLGENDWAGLSRYAEPRPCPDEAAFSAALRGFSQALDGLAAGIRDHRPRPERPGSA